MQTAAPRTRRPSAPPADRGASLRVVDEPGGQPLAVGLLGAFAFLSIFGALLGMVVFQTLLIQGQHDLDRLDRDLVVEQERLAELNLQVAQLESPDRVLRAAATRFGMIPPVERLPLDPVDPGSPGDRLPPPGDDPFGLIEHGAAPAPIATTIPSAR